VVEGPKGVQLEEEWRNWLIEEIILTLRALRWMNARYGS